MKTLLAAATLALLTVACSNETPAPEPAAAPEPAPKPEPKPEPVAEVAAFNAEATFKTTCGPCHGESGKGDGAAAAALDPKPANFNDASFWETRDLEHIKKVIKGGGAAVGKSPVMAPFGGQFDDAQIAQLAEYMQATFKPQ